MDRIAILGSGMAGFGAAHRLHQQGVTSTMYEKKHYHGGHTTSYKYDSGFVFDEGPHISFTNVERIQNLLAESVNQKYQVNKAYVNNYWKGHWIKHPAQCNLHGLPGDLLLKILQDFIHALHSEHGKIHNYADWLIATYGRSFAETFPMEYTIKYHTTTAANMSVDWLGPRMYRPKLEEVLRGALLPSSPDVHYVTEFRYPSYDGFISFLKIFLEQTTIKLEHAVAGIDPKKKTLRFKNGLVAPYNHIISSVPLPELIPMVEGVPKDVLEASRKLACTTAVIVSLGVNRADLINAHWTYFYDRDIFFTRLSTPHMQSPNNVPPGCGSLQAECYYSPKYRPLDRKPEECIPPVIADLKRVGLIREDDKILFSDAKLVPYANVIFDLDRAPSLKLVHAYLDEIGIAYCGRYGDWAYIWTDQAFMSGEKAAQKVLDRLGNNTR
jgi:protoporphyrinogen oxidase